MASNMSPIKSFQRRNIPLTLYIRYNHQMNLLLILLLGTFSLGLAEALNGQLLKRYEKISSVGLLIVGVTVSSILSFLVLIVTKLPTPILSFSDVGLIFLVGILYYYGNKLFYNSFKVQEASTSTIVVMSSIIVTTLYGKIVFNEQISSVQWLGIILVLVAVAFTNIGGFSVEKIKQIFKPTSVTKLVLFSALFYGLANGITKSIVQDISPIYYQFLISLLTIPIVFLIDWKESKQQISLLGTTGAYKLLALAIPFYYIYNVIKSIVYERGMALPLVDSIDNAVVFCIIILEFVIFRIKPENIWFKLLTATVAVVGVVLLGR